MSKVTGALSFGGIASAAAALDWLTHDLTRTALPNTSPEAWRVPMLMLTFLFAVWGVRLVVSMFLSHLQLASDAVDRVVVA